MVLAVAAVVGLLAVCVVALVALGQVAARLEAEPARQVFEGEEALEFVAEALPAELTAELSYDDARSIIRLHLDWLHARGVARSGGDLAAPAGPLVLDEEDGVRYILRRLGWARSELNEAQVRAVMAAQLAYFEAIGAAAEVVEPDLDAVLDEAPNGEGAGPRELGPG
ncbi:MAG: hypothetical protein ACKVWR_16975 [Acidimicrobiales bacterium]